jgi:hypothetical protein
MSSQGFGRSFYRLLTWGTRILLFVGLIIVAAPLWLAWALIVAILALARPFVTVPLGLASVGGVAVALYFGLQAHWADALQAGFVALLSSLVLIATES